MAGLMGNWSLKSSSSVPTLVEQASGQFHVVFSITLLKFEALDL